MKIEVSKLEYAKQRYCQLTNRSKTIFDEAQDLTPGGVKGNVGYFDPYPLTLSRGDGAWVTDVDGRKYVDYLLCYGPLMLGHGHPKIKEALQRVWDEKGTSLGVAGFSEGDFIKRIQKHYPSMEQIRFNSTGTEATQSAIRLAAAYTGRPSLAKFVGHYHGGHEQALVSMRPSDIITGDSRPKPTSYSYGLPEYYLENTLVLPFNNLEACERLLNEWKDRVGAVIMEPLQNGTLPADYDFIHGIRRVTEQLGMVFIIDEVKTGFRVNLGGAQKYYGVTPDLTTLGKVLGGGLPIGAFGGKKAIMELLSPFHPNGCVFHSGTFSGNPMSIEAGIATIDYLESDGHFDSVVKITNTLRKQLESMAADYGFSVKTEGIGTSFHARFIPENQTEEENRLFLQDQETRLTWDYLLLCNGVFLRPGYIFILSTCHGHAELTHTLNAMEKSFVELKRLM